MDQNIAVIPPYTHGLYGGACMALMYQSNRNLNIPLPGNPRAFEFLFKFPPPKAEELFRCPIIGPFQVIKCTHPGETFQ